jgi:hypothetical protein
VFTGIGLVVGLLVDWCSQVLVWWLVCGLIGVHRYWCGLAVRVFFFVCLFQPLVATIATSLAGGSNERIPNCQLSTHSYAVHLTSAASEGQRVPHVGVGRAEYSPPAVDREKGSGGAPTHG